MEGFLVYLSTLRNSDLCSALIHLFTPLRNRVVVCRRMFSSKLLYHGRKGDQFPKSAVNYIKAVIPTGRLAVFPVPSTREGISSASSWAALHEWMRSLRSGRDDSLFALCCLHLKIYAVILILMLCSSSVGWSQQLNADVQVDRSQLSGTSLSFLNNFGNEVEAYLNEHNWIDARFNEHERIDVTIRIILLNVDDGYNFEANLVISSRRPIYNSLQQTPLFLYNDENWRFNYTPNRGFTHDELQFDSITTLLDFYAYLILGYDFDSFSELGGTPYFNQAQSLVALAQISSDAGWARTGSVRRNRARLIADLLNPNFTGLRRAIYVYHRRGLDQFLNNPGEARQLIITSLEMIEEAAKNTSSNLLFNTFFDAKYREIVSVFEDAPTDVRLKAYTLLSRIDPGHLSEYDKLR